jgi:GST-like protein
MASYPWIVPHKRQEQDITSFPNLNRWFEAIRARPAVAAAYARAEEISSAPVVDDNSKSILFNQGRR